MIKNKVTIEVSEYVHSALNMIIQAEEQDPDFTIIRELAEQLLDELEALEE